jgi:cytochrome c556
MFQPAHTARTALVAVVMAVAAAQAQQQQQQAPQQQQEAKPQGAAQQAGAPAEPPQTSPPKPLIPVAASTLAAAPDPYYGEPVSLAGIVDQTLSPTAFSVDQDRTGTGKDVLVVAPKLQRQVAANTYVTVIGEVVRFDPAALASKLKEYKLDLAADVAGRYTGRPAVIATSVVDSTGTDVARRLPPPMTAEEEAYQKLMKQIASSNGALRKAIETPDAKVAAEHSGALRKTFAEVEAFWRTQRQQDAVRWAQDARKLSENIERSIAAGRWDAVKSHAGHLGKTCQACHGVHRDRFDDGSYRIKKPPTT